MASLGVHYVKSRLECKDCQRKNKGLTGIAAKCLAIEVREGATHKYYHPNCFFQGPKCSDVIDKLPYKTADEMTGYKTLSHSDQLMIYSLFANATDGGEDEDEAKKIEQRKERAAANRRAKKGDETAAKGKKSKKDEDDEETPKKKRRTEKKEKKNKKVEQSDEEEVIKTKTSSNRRSNKEKNQMVKNEIPSNSRPSRDVSMDEELDEIEVPREEKKAQRVKKTPSEHERKKDEVLTEGPLKATGRAKPSDKMAAVFEKVFKRKIDEQVDLELDTDEEW